MTGGAVVVLGPGRPQPGRGDDRRRGVRLRPAEESVRGPAEPAARRGSPAHPAQGPSLHRLVERHAQLTGSARAKAILADWEDGVTAVLARGHQVRGGDARGRLRGDAGPGLIRLGFGVPDASREPAPDGVTPSRPWPFSNERFPGTAHGQARHGVRSRSARSDCVARVPVEGNTQVYGMLHGGATAALCETHRVIRDRGLRRPRQGGHRRRAQRQPHPRRPKRGYVTATADPLHVGRTTAVWDMKVHDDEGRLVAASRLTLAIRDARR